MRKALWVFALTMLLALPAIAQQPTTGTMQGVVADQEGNALPGATVSISGPLGTRGTQTDANGNFEFRFIPPGVYNVRTEMSGFATVEISRVEINVGQRTRLPITLLPGQTEEVTVTSAAPLMDPKRLEVVTNFKSDQTVETLPVGRNFTQAVAFAPGVVSGLGTGQGNYSIGGASGLENSYIIDGVNITDSGYGGVGSYSIVFGSLGTGITTDFLEEIQIKTAGFEAEFGQALGGIVNGVVKSGTNELAGSVKAYLTPASWEAKGKDVVLPSGFTNVHNRGEEDLAVSASGPIIKDRMFWFAAYNPVSGQRDLIRTVPDNVNPVFGDPAWTDYTSRLFYPAAGKELQEERDRDNYAAKLNWLITPNHRVELTAFGDPSDGDGQMGTAWSADIRLPNSAGGSTKTGVGYPVGGVSQIEYGADAQALRYNGLFGADWFLEAQVSHRENEFTEKGYNDNRYRDRRLLQLGISSVQPLVGGPGFLTTQDEKTWDYSVKLSKVIGNHELKGGMQYWDLEYQQPTIYSGDPINFTFPGIEGGTVQWTSTGGALVDLRCQTSTACDTPFYRVVRTRFNAPGTTTGKEMAFFLQDTWTLSDKWVVKLGVRSVEQKLEGSAPFELPEMAIGGGTYEPNKYTFDTEISPRVGVSFDPWANGKTKIFANYARYFERVPSDLAVRQFSNEVGASQYDFLDPQLTVPRGGGIALQGVTPGVIQPDTKLPYEDEFVIGWQQLLRPDLSLEVRGIYRDQGRTLEDVQFTTVEEIQNYYYAGLHEQEGDVNGDGTDEIYYDNVPDPFPAFGRNTFGAYVLANPGDNTPSVLPKLKREYKAIEFEINKRLSNNWQFRANYRYSRLRGNYEGLFRNDNGQSDPNITSLADFPNSPLMRGQFASGPLNTDRPHVLNILGTYIFENGFELGGALRWQSGTPRTALLAHPNYQNSGELPGQDPIYYDYACGDPELDEDGTYYAQCEWFETDSGLFLKDYTDAPRGSIGRTPDYAAIDLHAGYAMGIKDTRLKVTLDVFNLFNNTEPEDLDDAVEVTAGVLNPTFNKIIGYQRPRSVRVAAIWDW